MRPNPFKIYSASGFCGVNFPSYPYFTHLNDFVLLEKKNILKSAWFFNFEYFIFW